MYIYRWPVRTAMGKWRIKTDAYQSNTVSFKINKRAQITELATYWAQSGLTRDETTAITGGDGSCDGLNNYIYQRLGLNPGGRDCKLGKYDDLADDNGDGALIFFYYRYDRPTKPQPDSAGKYPTPAHAGILSGGSRIDCNGPSLTAHNGAGPAINARDRWCTDANKPGLNHFWGDTYPTRTVKDPASGRSWLKVLDEEK